MTQISTMRLIGVFTLLALSLGAGPAMAQEPPIKIAVVDVERIVTESTAGKALQTRLDNFREQIEAELQNKAQAAAKLRQDAALTSDPAQRAQLSKQYEDAAIALKREQDDRQREGQKLQDEGLREIERNLAPVFQQVRDEQGYDMILAHTPGVVLMVSPRVDITQQVLDRFNASTQ
jgi:outer membrane protein